MTAAVPAWLGLGLGLIVVAVGGDGPVAGVRGRTAWIPSRPGVPA